MTEERRVVITKPVIGLVHMQVCAVADATNEEILETCNNENPSGTAAGWGHVIREEEPEDTFWHSERLKPVQCAESAERKHFIVSC